MDKSENIQLPNISELRINRCVEFDMESTKIYYYEKSDNDYESTKNQISNNIRFKQKILMTEQMLENILCKKHSEYLSSK